MVQVSTTSAPPVTPVGVAIVDAHTHIFPAEVNDRKDVFLGRDPWFGELYGHPLARVVTAEEMVHSMEVAGFAQSIACGFPWSDPGLCRMHNDYMHESSRHFPGRLPWLATVAPLDPGAGQEAERCFELGAVGIGELNADGQGFDFRQPEQLAPLVEVCLAHDRPIMFHTSEPLGHTYPGKGTASPEKFIQFLQAFPDLRVVAAHWGGGLPFYELMPEIRLATANLVYDSGASTKLYRFDVFRSVIDVVGHERVLFGSDYPVLKQRRFLRSVLQAGLNDDELPAILETNARRVYCLPAAVSAP